MLRWNRDVHHQIVASRFELEREERTALAFASSQIAGGSLDDASQDEVQSLRVLALSSYHEGEQVVEFRDTQRSFRRR